MDIYSDLAIEFAENLINVGLESARKESTCSGIKSVYIDLRSPRLASKVGKRRGEYLSYEKIETDGDIVGNMAGGIRELIEDTSNILLVGLGNPRYRADSLGDMTLDYIDIKTNNIRKIKPLCAGETGIESLDIIKATVKAVKPSGIIAIDTLATTSLARLGNCYQLTTSGIIPGSGVGNSRKLLNNNELGVPVLAIGVPLVISLSALSDNIRGKENIDEEKYRRMIITPGDIDEMVRACAENIALSISIGLNK